jgi:hypothetical protein
VAGASFLLVGILGFVPGLTTDYAELSLARQHSEAKLLGLFQLSVLHNLVHLAFGIIGLAASRTSAGARTFLLGAGVTYLVLTVYGVLIDHNSAANFVPVNHADNILHLGLGMVAAAVVLGKTAARPVAAGRH